jgi:hypothetical protein
VLDLRIVVDLFMHPRICARKLEQRLGRIGPEEYNIAMVVAQIEHSGAQVVSFILEIDIVIERARRDVSDVSIRRQSRKARYGNRDQESTERQTEDERVTRTQPLQQPPECIRTSRYVMQSVLP